MTTDDDITKTPPRGEATATAKALSHPIRAAVLVALGKRESSPARLARQLGVPVENVAYHVNTLLRLDMIELAETRPVRGGVEHFYRAARRAEIDDAGWADMAEPARRELAFEWLRHAFGELTSAIEDGSVSSTPDVHLSLTALELTDESWALVAERLVDLIDFALRLQVDVPVDRRRTARLVMALFAPDSS
jgi:DNA-binding transcriptional ArsR family regulator